RRVVPFAAEVVLLHAEWFVLPGRRVVALAPGRHRPDVTRIAVDDDGHLLGGLVDLDEQAGARRRAERGDRERGEQTGKSTSTSTGEATHDPNSSSPNWREAYHAARAGKGPPRLATI